MMFRCSFCVFLILTILSSIQFRLIKVAKLIMKLCIILCYKLLFSFKLQLFACCVIAHRYTMTLDSGGIPFVSMIASYFDRKKNVQVLLLLHKLNCVMILSHSHTTCLLIVKFTKRQCVFLFLVIMRMKLHFGFQSSLKVAELQKVFSIQSYLHKELTKCRWTLFFVNCFEIENIFSNLYYLTSTKKREYFRACYVAMEQKTH